MERKLMIRALREARGMTQTKLAELAGLSQSTISVIEGGGTTTTAALESIAEALECQMADLWAKEPG